MAILFASLINSPTRFLLLSILLSQTTAQQFVNPPANDAPPANKQLSKIEVKRFDTLEVEWECSFPAWRLWVFPNDGDSGLRSQFIDRGQGARSGLKRYTYTWTADTTFNYSQWNFYFKVQNEEDPENSQIYSQLFKITEPEAGTKTGPVRTSTVTVSPAGAERSGEKKETNGGGLSTAAKAGICVGVTVGVLIALGMGFFLGQRWVRKREAARSDAAIGLLRTKKPKKSKKEPMPQDLSSLDPKWQNWGVGVKPVRSSEDVDDTRGAAEVNGQSLFPREVELTADERRERHELAEDEYRRWRGFEYGERSGSESVSRSRERGRSRGP